MAEKKQTTSYFSLRNEIIQHKFRQIYLLQGDEPYYIDKLSDCVVDNALTEDDKDFNLSIFYGNDANIREVISACKEYPAFAQYKVVVLREAQNVPKQSGGKNKDLDLLAKYAESPSPTTILIVCNKGVDRDVSIKSKPFLDALKSNPNFAVFNSAKIRNDRDLKSVVASYASEIGCSIDDKSISMLSDCIGYDLARMFTELDKLKLLVGADNRITPELIEKNIGISKDFNTFELEDALAVKDTVKVYRIIKFFEKNPKQNPVQRTIAALFSFYSNLLLIRTSKDKSQQALMKVTGTASTWKLNKLIKASQTYSTLACVNIISYLRECDVKSKGQGSRQDAFALFSELIFKILHS